MNAHRVGLAAPRMVPSCIIKNNSNSNIQVQILYKGLAHNGRGADQEVATGIIPTGGTFRAEERTMDHGSYQTRKEIAAIEVTRTNGQKQRLTAPFNGVHRIELDWLFVIDNWQIYSVNKNQ